MAVGTLVGFGLLHAKESSNREHLFAALKPVRLKNCAMKRFGGAHDGGYVMCENLLSPAQVAYSYGIDGGDDWGCDIARELGVPVHQYDCFNPTRPVCEGATFLFHDECVGGVTAVIDGRAFDTVPRHLAKNGDAGKRLVLKMDVEGSEWDAFPAIPDEVLSSVQQISMEFHGTSQARFLSVVEKLKTGFYVANVHFNNTSCTDSVRPFPAWAYEVLWVNKKVGVLDEASAGPNPLDSPNAPALPDCQVRW